MPHAEGASNIHPFVFNHLKNVKTILSLWVILQKAMDKTEPFTVGAVVEQISRCCSSYINQTTPSLTTLLIG